MLLTSGLARAATVVEVVPLTDQMVIVRVLDGAVRHSANGQPFGDESVVTSPLNIIQATNPASYQISSTNDAFYIPAQAPVQVGRKTKGTDFAWLNPPNNWALEHWLYLKLPRPLKQGSTYVINTGTLSSNGRLWTFTFDESKTRSEAVHVNLLGYVPAASRKYAYVFHWAGDLGGLDLSGYAGHAFHLINQQTGRADFSGVLNLRFPATQVETGHGGQTVGDNFEGAGVYECDFSAFTRTGQYVVAVDGIGCSFPFQIGDDVYRPAFFKVTRALYHNRSGIALLTNYTTWPRPTPHNPVLTPGFTNKLFYTTTRFMEWGSEGGSASALTNGSAFKGFIQSAGWYQDAGDFDSYITHFTVPISLLFTYEAAPRNFRPGELNLPESTNGLPDILNEAAWLPRFGYRLRHELMAKGYAAGGLGLRIAGDAFGGDTVPGSYCNGSWQDTNRLWAASGADPWSTYFYAGVSAHLAYCLSLAGKADPQGIDWLAEATNAYAWAQSNTLPGDNSLANGQVPCALSAARSYAAAAIFRLTGEKRYEYQLKSDYPNPGSFNHFAWDQGFASYPVLLYALGAGTKANYDADYLAWARGTVIASGNQWLIATPSHRSLRWGGNFYFPMVVGLLTAPNVTEGIMAYAVAKSMGPAQAVTASNYLAALHTTADFFLGCNSLNTTWATGLGARHPNQIFKLDCFALGAYYDGVVPYGPWKTENPAPGWVTDHDFANLTCYPSVGSVTVPQWPGGERWHDNRWSPMSSEFTIAQTIAPTAALFGFLAAPGP